MRSYECITFDAYFNRKYTVTCPFYGAKYDVTTGKELSEPILTPSQEMEPLPQTWQKFFENVGQLVAHIKTYDQIAYETRIDEEDILFFDIITLNKGIQWLIL